MNLSYLAKELYYQRRRTIASIAGLSIGIALLIIFNALSAAYYEAARSPLKEIGADLTVQRPGNVPESLSGAVFPCSAVTIRDEQVKKLKDLPGVRTIGKAVLIWVFDGKGAQIVLGIEQDNSVGPVLLRSAVTEGRFIEEGKNEAAVETSYARQFNIKPGDNISISGKQFSVTGLVDASRVAKIAVANVYIPISEAQKLAAASRLIQSVSPFSASDVNLLFIRADHNKIHDIATAVTDIVDKKATIGTPESFLKLLGSLFALSDRFALAASLIAMIIAILISFKTTAGNIAERTREIGILKAVGWTSRNTISQLFSESIVMSFIAGIAGLCIAYIAAFGLRFLKVDIPIPWDMVPRPHFLPGGGDQIYKTLQLPVHISMELSVFAVLLSVAIGAVTSIILTRNISRIKPSEVLRHE